MYLSYGCSITTDVPLEIVDSGDHFPRTQSRPLLRDVIMLALVGAFSLLNPRIPRLGTCYQDVLLRGVNGGLLSRNNTKPSVVNVLFATEGLKLTNFCSQNLPVRGGLNSGNLNLQPTRFSGAEFWSCIIFLSEFLFRQCNLTDVQADTAILIPMSLHCITSFCIHNHSHMFIHFCGVYIFFLILVEVFLVLFKRDILSDERLESRGQNTFWI